MYTANTDVIFWYTRVFGTHLTHKNKHASRSMCRQGGRLSHQWKQHTLATWQPSRKGLLHPTSKFRTVCPIECLENGSCSHRIDDHMPGTARGTRWSPQLLAPHRRPPAWHRTWHPVTSHLSRNTGEWPLQHRRHAPPHTRTHDSTYHTNFKKLSMLINGQVRSMGVTRKFSKGGHDCQPKKSLLFFVCTPKAKTEFFANFRL